MAITNGYVDLEEAKKHVDIDDHEDDAALETSIETISRAIDDITWRRFYAVTETRYYTPDKHDCLNVDDLLDITGVTGWIKTDEDGDRTYENEWATTDYDLMPFNAALDDKPYTSIEITPNGSYRFPKGLSRSIELRGSFGYSATTPKAIHDACLLGLNRLLARKSTPLGVSAAAGLGQLRVVVTNLKADPDFMDLIRSFIRPH